MLRLIVLGEIPGTDIYLSWTQALLVLGGFYAFVLALHELHHHQPAEPRLEDIAL